MPRPRSLTPTDIAVAALAVVDRDRLAGLTMRAVAAELGMGTMSLYRYVADRDQLESLILDLVLAEVDLTPPRGPWRGQIAALAERVRDAISAHPEVAPLTMTHRHHSRNILRWGEVVLGILTSAGFAGEHRVIALRTLVGYVIGSIQLDHLGPLSGEGTAAMAGLPDFPLLAETARTGQRMSDNVEFSRGLAVVLSGLGSIVDGKAAPR